MFVNDITYSNAQVTVSTKAFTAMGRKIYRRQLEQGANGVDKPLHLS